MSKVRWIVCVKTGATPRIQLVREDAMGVTRGANIQHLQQMEGTISLKVLGNNSAEVLKVSRQGEDTKLESTVATTLVDPHGRQCSVLLQTKPEHGLIILHIPLEVHQKEGADALPETVLGQEKGMGVNSETVYRQPNAGGEQDDQNPDPAD